MAHEGTEQRKLAAIMFTDMVGYSALAQRNEVLALDLLEGHRALLRPLFPRFNGTEIKTIGDAFLVEFHSALEAAQCAIEIQRALAKRNHDVASEHRIEIKIGIHIGDVVHRGGDVYGDGVNIASRIEPLAGAGGICVSMDVERQIRNALEAKFEKLAPTELKNISVPMDLFRIVLPWEKRETSRREHTKPERRLKSAPAWAIGLVALLILALIGVWTHPWRGAGEKKGSAPAPGERVPVPAEAALDKRRVAVLPLVNLSSDPENEYFAQQMTEQLVTKLSDISGLRVIRVTGTNLAAKELAQLGQELKVGAVLRGSASKAGNQLRINVLLAEVASSANLWARDFQKEFKDVFAIQSEVAERVASALQVTLLAAEKQQIEKRPTEHLEAYTRYLQARSEWHKFTPDGFNRCLEHARAALDLDPNFALAWQLIAAAYSAMGSMGYMSPKEAWPLSEAALDKATALDSQLAETHAARGAIALFKWDWETARRELERATQLKPSYPDGYELYSFYLVAMGRLPEALAAITRAQELEPLRPNAAAHIGFCNIYLGQFDRAIQVGRKGLLYASDFPNLRAMLAVAHVAKGNPAEAVAVMQQMKGIQDNPFALSYLGYAYGAAGQKDDALRVLEKFQAFPKSTPLAATYWARVYLGLGETRRALEHLERLPDEGGGFVPFIKVQPPFDQLRSDPRFLALLKRLGLEK